MPEVDLSMHGALEAALEFAERGMAVFPLRPGTKIPATQHGLLDATTDRQTIMQWFAAGCDYGLAVATGEPAKVVVLDVDVKDGAQGYESLRRLAPPPTLTARTKNGGWHLWFVHPGRRVRTQAAVLPGIDVRGDGGYVVAPPTPGYEWETAPDTPLASWDAFAAQLPRRGPPNAPTLTPPATPIPQGRRNAELTSRAGTMRRAGMTPDAILAALRETPCDPPLADEELVQIATSVGRYPPAALEATMGDTDSDIADRLRAYLDNGVHYVAERKRFLLYRGGTWRPDTLGTIRTAGQALGHQMRPSSPAGKRLLMTSGLDAVVSALKSRPGVAISESCLDLHRDLLAFRNGVVDLRTGRLLPHDRQYLQTRCVDIDYDPDALAPAWEQFLADIFPSHADLPEYVQRLIGYGITGHTREHLFAVLYGIGANGKSTFTTTLAAVFAAIAANTPFATFERRRSDASNDVARLNGSRLVFGSEGAGTALDEARVKSLTSDEVITARWLYGEFFEFRPTFLIVMATNHRPVLHGADAGLWRRLKLLPFDRKFADEEQEKGIGERFVQEEASGIAAWAVRGAIAWYERGLQDAPSVTDAVGRYRNISDRLAGFLPGVVEPDASARTNGAEVVTAYRAWAEREGLTPRETLGRNKLYAALEERDVVRHPGGAVFGLRFTADTPPTEDLF